MGKKGKKAQAGRPKKVTPKDISKKLDALITNLEEELKGADLFAPLPPTEDCPVCLLPLPHIHSEIVYHSCCGKDICGGCFRENRRIIETRNETRSSKNKAPIPYTCPFCRAPTCPKPEDEIQRVEAIVSRTNDHRGLIALAQYVYSHDKQKALGYWIRAAELGSEEACTNIALSYRRGLVGSVDEERAKFFDRIGALRGCIIARHRCGRDDYYSGNFEGGIRHWKIAAEAGNQLSLNRLRDIYNADGKMPGKELISKEYLDRAFRKCAMMLRKKSRARIGRDIAFYQGKCVK